MLAPEHIVLRLALAAVLGSIIGFERERRDWAAGLRDHMLVCLGAALFMIVSSYGFSDVLGTNVILDPSRVAAQVVTGIGFLGAGTILVRGEVIRGLTTAASLWVIAAVGLAAGGGLYLAATFTTVLLLLILAWLKPFEKWLFPEKKSYDLSLHMVGGTVDIVAIEKAIEALKSDLLQITISRTEQPDKRLVRLTIRKPKGIDIAQVIEVLQHITSVESVEYHRL